MEPVWPNEPILALARGDPRRAAEVFRNTLHLSLPPTWSAGIRSRHLAWNGTLTGMALAAAGDTVAVRALADSVEMWGQGSLYGRDRRAHHYLRGMVHQAGGRHEDAVREFRAAIHSPTMGFTRVNYELARSLLGLRRPREAVAALQPALRGDIEAGNFYVAHTELHELLRNRSIARECLTALPCTISRGEGMGARRQGILATPGRCPCLACTTRRPDASEP